MFSKSVLPMSLDRFFGFSAADINEKINIAHHMYAVYTAMNQRRHSGTISGEEEVYELLRHGHKKAVLYMRTQKKVHPHT